MTRRVEGVNGSYVGPDDPHLGARTGDRFFILSDEGPTVHVRWTTGSLQGEYGIVRSRHVVADRMATAFDEFGFEAGMGAPSAMGIDVTALHRAGGDVALIEAMESEGHLDGLRSACAAAARLVRDAVQSDPSWMMVREALAPQTSSAVEHSAIIAAFIAAVESGDDEDEMDEEPL